MRASTSVDIPFAVHARRCHGRLDAESEVEHVDQALNHGRDDAPPAWRADRQQRLAIAQHERRRRRPQDALPGLDGVHVARLRVEPGHAVVQHDASAAGNHTRAEQLAQRRGARHHRALGVDHVEMRRAAVAATRRRHPCTRALSSPGKQSPWITRPRIWLRSLQVDRVGDRTRIGSREQTLDGHVLQIGVGSGRRSDRERRGARLRRSGASAFAEPLPSRVRSNCSRMCSASKAVMLPEVGDSPRRRCPR